MWNTVFFVCHPPRKSFLFFISKVSKKTNARALICFWSGTNNFRKFLGYEKFVRVCESVYMSVCVRVCVCVCVCVSKSYARKATAKDNIKLDVMTSIHFFTSCVGLLLEYIIYWKARRKPKLLGSMN